MTRLAAEMRAAWEERRRRAADDLIAANVAPALFKPEWSERARAEIAKARREIARWSS